MLNSLSCIFQINLTIISCTRAIIENFYYYYFLANSSLSFKNVLFHTTNQFNTLIRVTVSVCVRLLRNCLKLTLSNLNGSRKLNLNVVTFNKMYTSTPVNMQRFRMPATINSSCHSDSSLATANRIV